MKASTESIDNTSLYADGKSLASTTIAFDESEEREGVTQPGGIASTTTDEAEKYIEKPDTPSSLKYEETQGWSYSLAVNFRKFVLIVRKALNPKTMLFQYTMFGILVILLVILCVHYEKEEERYNTLLNMVKATYDEAVQNNKQIDGKLSSVEAFVRQLNKTK